MKTFDLLDAIGDIDDEKISKAKIESLEVRRASKKKKRFAMAAVAATVAASLAITVNFYLPQNSAYNTTEIVYADELDVSELIYNGSGEKAVLGKSLSTLPENSRAKLFIAIRDYYDKYPDIVSDCPEVEGMSYTQIWDWDDSNYEMYQKGTISHDEYSELFKQSMKAQDDLDKRIIDLEIKRLEEIGAEDIEIKSNTIITCVMNENDIDKIKDGKCRYLVALAPKDCGDDIAPRKIEDWYGNYVGESVVHVPLISSSAVYDAKRLKLTISKDEFKISPYIGAKVQNPKYKQFGNNNLFDERDPKFGLIDEFASKDMILLKYTATGGFCVDGVVMNIYTTNDTLYVDLGMQGIIKCARVD